MRLACYLMVTLCGVGEYPWKKWGLKMKNNDYPQNLDVGLFWKGLTKKWKVHSEFSRRLWGGGILFVLSAEFFCFKGSLTYRHTPRTSWSKFLAIGRHWKTPANAQKFLKNCWKIAILRKSGKLVISQPFMDRLRRNQCQSIRNFS